MRLYSLLLVQIILLQYVAVVAAKLSRVTGPLSLKPVITGVLVAPVAAYSPAG